MVEQTVKTYACDICGEVGERYTIVYPDGLLNLDRCSRHNTKIERLRTEKGAWGPEHPAKSSFKVSTTEDIKRQKKKE